MVFVDGAGLLTLDQFVVGDLCTVEHLEVSVPDLRLPADLTAGASRFRNRRGRFRGATIGVRLAQVAAYLDRCDLAAAGLSNVSVSVDASGSLRWAARARLGGRQADLTGRIALRRQGERRLRISVEDLHVFGYLPVPAPIAAGALLGAALPTAGPGAPGAEGATRSTVRWQTDVDVLELALLEVFVASGWRLPDFSVATLETIATSSQQIIIVFGEAGLPSTAAARLDDDQASDEGDAGEFDESGARLREADGLLARGDYLAALACLRQLPTNGAADPRVTERTLQLLLAGAATRDQAAALAAEILAHDETSVPALLAQATVATERREHGRAADLFLAVAAIAEARGQSDDVAFASAAAAAQRAAADQLPPAAKETASGATSGATMPAVGAAADVGAVGGVPLAVPLSPSQRLAARCEELIAARNFDEADRVFAERIDHAPDEATAALLATERARVRLLGPGATAALAVLRTIPLRSAPEEALVLRADLGERQSSLDDALPALEELAARARSAGEASTRQQLQERSEALRVRVHGRPRTPADELERTLTANPTDPTAAEELATIYLELADPRERIDALSSLLRRALGLSAARRKQIYASLGETAEASGDLEQAEQAYWRAATIEANPGLRAHYLAAHARVLLARGDVQTALAELEEAIAQVPDHAVALALLADVAFRQQDWARARQAYAALENAPGAADVITREHLMLRRAELAEAAGDDGEAETCYREVAILNPRHIDARRVLAEIALRRQDLGGGALRLEEVLRLLPLDALDQLLDVRQSLGSVYVQLEDWGSAKYYLELVLAQDPGRVAALELLVGVYLQLGLPRQATAACERLARLYQEPSKRARILYRQGEILRAEIGDDAAAFDAFLKASDVDPRFAPTMVRLVEYFWHDGDFTAVAEVASDLVKAGTMTANPDPELGMRIAIATALAGQRMPAAAATAREAPWNPTVAARALAEAGDHLVPVPTDALDRALAALVAQVAGGDGDVAFAALAPALATLIEDDPSRPGPVRALARIAERRGQATLARALYALLVFADPNDAGADRLEELGPATVALPEALDALGPTVHVDAAGPLRGALVALAAALQGFETAVVPSGGDSLRPARAAGLRRLGHLLHAPPFAVAVQPAGVLGQSPLVVAPTRPAMLLVSTEGAELPEREWGFAAARALEELRSGLASLSGLTAGELIAFLQGVAAALAGTPLPAEAAPKAQAAVHWLTESDAVTELPVGEARARLAADVGAVLTDGVNWPAFVAGGVHTANRVGLLVCGSPLDALRRLAHADSVLAAAASDGGDGGDGGDGDEKERREARRGFLRTSAIRELVRYLLSDEYAGSLTPP
ncbi:MAG: hypothetical protein QOI66_4930 [Myxococcales bacterium]|nr:hypothetical protein [Myxococcales bacterium]